MPGLPPEIPGPDWLEELVPREIEAVLDRRLLGLSPQARDCLQLAAAIGDPFDLRVLENLLGGIAALDAALPALEEEELVAPTSSPYLYRFVHTLILQRVYRGTAEGSRWKLSRLHARIAEAMATLYSAEELSGQSLVYAHHLVLGRREEEGLRFPIQGTGRLLDSQLYASAVSHLEMARDLAARGVPIGERDRVVLLRRLGETYRVLGRTEEALAALDLARGSGGAQPGDLAFIDLARGSILVQGGDLDAAEAVFRALLPLEGPAQGLEAAAALSSCARPPEPTPRPPPRESTSATSTSTSAKTTRRSAPTAGRSPSSRSGGSRATSSTLSRGWGTYSPAGTGGRRRSSTSRRGGSAGRPGTERSSE
ncbi:MAG: hypothetical protein ACRD2T_14455, partial [Thermoanaerobaculia bacterium]